MRFPGFTDEWKKTTLGEIGNTFNGLSGKSSQDFGHGSPYITYKSVFDSSKIDISRVEYVTITDSERNKSTQNVVKYGDIFFTTSSETPNEVGMTSVLLDDVEDCYLNSFCFGYRLSNQEETLPEYLRFYLRSHIIRNKISILAQGSTRFNISKSEVMRMGISLPSGNEQKKIAKLLSLIDERIATQNKIIEDLKKLKSAINQKLFDGAVSTFRIGDVLIEENLRTKENNQYDVLSSTVGGLCLQSEYFNKEVASEDNSGYKILLKDRIVLSPQNLWLGNINYNELFEIGIVSPSYKIFRISNSINKIYLAEVLRSQYALYQYSISSEQGASVVRRNLNVEDFLNINFPKVSIEKQESFAKLLISVNNKLRNNTTILSQFLIQKRYLLSQMFI